MADDLTGQERPGAAARAILRLLAGEAGERLVLLVAPAKAGRVRIEEAYPPVAAVGSAVAAPDGLLADGPRVIATANGRLPLAWTALAGARPAAIGAVPIEGTGRHLVCAAKHAPLEMAPMLCAAEAIGALGGAGPLTAGEYHSSQGLHSLVDNLPVPLIFVDSRTVEVFVNDPARTLLDLPKHGLSNGRVAAKLARLVADEYSASRDFNLANAPHADIAFEIEREGRAYKVESKWVDDGVLVGRLWLFRDVTREQAAARMKDQFVATVSHELRTPLTAIIGALGLLQANAVGDLNDRAASLVGMARRNGDRLVKIVNDLLDMEKIQSGKMTYEFAPLDLGGLIDDVAQQNAAYAQAFGVRLRIDRCEGPVVTQADEGRLAQVLTNLISNAAKFSSQGSEIVLRLENAGDNARISVIDQGRGISEEFRQRLFTRFSQDRESTVPGYASSGLGLAISKSIVEAHGGTIGLDETTTVGATFLIDLPLARDAANCASHS